mmetsp:Transcript_33607/g.89097  ORF Transcript_33607/g.89097 Transcript_33607/m.89097 type:complete len:226 (-) Transcript_33607:284-961(-)
MASSTAVVWNASNCFCSYSRISLPRSTYSLHAAWPSGECSRCGMVLKASTGRFARWKMLRAQMMAPAVGGVLFGIGGQSLLLRKSCWKRRTSLPYWIRMSVNFSDILSLICLRESMFLKFWSSLNAPSADRRFWKELFRKSMARSSIRATRSLNFVTRLSQCGALKSSKTDFMFRKSVFRLSTSFMRSSMPCESPVTSLSSGPRKLPNWSRTWEISKRSRQTLDM